MQRIFLSFLGLILINFATAQPAIQIVRAYGEALGSWAETRKDDVYRTKLIDLCDKGSLFKDKLTHKIVDKEKYGYLDNYQVASFLNGLQKIVDNQVSINISNIQSVPKDEIIFANNNSRNERYANSELQLISCDVSISGSFSYNGPELIYIRKGKITKIDDYVVTVNSTGKKKVKVDFSDIMDDYETWGIGYNYGKNWPIGLSANYSYRMFMIGADLGVNLDKDKIYKHNLEMTDVMNFHKEDIEYDPLFFFTVTPSLYIKYASIGCGAGILYMVGKKYTADSSYGSYEEDCSKVKFMLRPSIKGFIPLADEMSLSLSVGYDYAFGYKEKNGINFGLGFQFNLDW